jgi:hypothetical protein
MYAKFPKTITFVAVNLTGIAAKEHLALDDLGVEQGRSRHRESQQ